MRKVRLHFSLVGRTRYIVKSLLKKENEGISNELLLEQIKEQVKFHFGDRAILVSDEFDLFSKYPDCYAAGWFVSEDGKTSGTDLIVISHGESMKSAQNAVMEAIRLVEWDDLASRY